MTRLTFDPGVDRYAIWSRDGSNKIYFDSARRGPRAIFEISPDAPGSESLLLESPLDKVVNDVTSDGSTIVLGMADPQTGWDLWTLPLKGEHKPVLLLKTNFEERRAQFSPDGKWVAYMSNESGQQEVYVRPSNGSSAQWQISNGGGYFARWARDGKELFYLSSDGTLMAAPITVKGSAIDYFAGVPLFHTRIVGGGTDVNLGIQFDVSRDGRFLINTLLDEVGASPITLLQNWNPKRAK
jgi:Tol biopolymer transport system component